MIHIRYFLLEAVIILAALGFGGSLLYDSLSQTGRPLPLIGGAALLAAGATLAYSAVKSLYRQLQSRASEG